MLADPIPNNNVASPLCNDLLLVLVFICSSYVRVVQWQGPFDLYFGTILTEALRTYCLGQRQDRAWKTEMRDEVDKLAIRLHKSVSLCCAAVFLLSSIRNLSALAQRAMPTRTLSLGLAYAASVLSRFWTGTEQARKDNWRLLRMHG